MPADGRVQNAKKWVFTLNNWTQTEYDCIIRTANTDEVVYCIVGKETGESGTPHLQGFIILRTRRRRRWLQRRGFERAYLDVARANNSTNRDYCAKAGEFVEIGEMAADRARMENGDGNVPRGDDSYGQLVQSIVEGMDLRTVAQTYPALWIRHASNIRTTYSMFLREPVSVYYGPWRWTMDWTWDRSIVLRGRSGVGKTEWAKSLIENPLLISHIDELRSFDRNFHGGIIFDDMDFSHWPRTSQIHLLDQDNQRAIHVRYGIVTIPAHTKKIFTTNVMSLFTLPDPALSRRMHVFECE